MPAQPKTRKTRTDAAPRSDGWQNLLTGLGTVGADKMQTTRFAKRSPITPEYDQLVALFRQSWVAKRIVSELVKDGTRAGFRVEFADDPELGDAVLNLWAQKNLDPVLRKGFTWALVFGGAVGLLLTDGETLDPNAQAPLAEPLDLGSVKTLQNVLIVDARYALPNLSQVTTDPKSDNFTLPETYTVTPFLAGGVLPQYMVHWSRLIRFEGAEVDNLTRVENRSWGDSIFEAIFDVLRQHGTIMASVAVTASEFAQGVLKMKDLSLNMGSDQNAALVNRLIAFKAMLGTTGIAAVDAELEEYTRLGQPVTGLADLIDEYKEEICGAIGMPRSRLYGNQAGKLAGAEQDSNIWAETVHGWQQYTLAKPIRTLVRLLLTELGKPDAPFTISFNDIAAPDLDKEIARRKVQADIDHIYFGDNVLEPSEIRNARFAGTAYSHETTLDPEITEGLRVSEEAARENAAKAGEQAEQEPPQTGEQEKAETGEVEGEGEK